MQRKGVRTGRKIAFVGEIDEEKSCGHGEVVLVEICEGNVADDDDAEKDFLFDDGSSNKKIFSKSSKTYHTRSSCIIWSEVCE